MMMSFIYTGNKRNSICTAVVQYLDAMLYIFVIEERPVLICYRLSWHKDDIFLHTRVYWTKHSIYSKHIYYQSIQSHIILIFKQYYNIVYQTYLEYILLQHSNTTLWKGLLCYLKKTSFTTENSREHSTRINTTCNQEMSRHQRNPAITFKIGLLTISYMS